MINSKQHEATYVQPQEKIGLFFGSFNPIHIGHLIISHSMLENSNLNKIWFVVTPQNPFKKNKNLLHKFDRYDLIKAAIADNYRLEVSDIEFNMPQPNYTIHTLTALTEKFPKKKFVMIMGEDNIKNFHQWKNQKAILDYYEIYVYPRPASMQEQKKWHPHIKLIEAPLLDISATYIRNAIKNKKSIQYLVPTEVEKMIKAKRFYLM